MRALLAGHISLDIRGGQKLLGGPPLYQIPVLEAFGFEIDVLTAFAQEEVELRSIYPLVNFIVINSQYTTTYQFNQINKIKAIDDDRELILKFKANEITHNDLSQLDDHYDIVIISPIASEFSHDVILTLLKLGDYSFFDIQGIVRKFDDNGLVHENLDINEFNNLLSLFDVIKTSKSEIEQIKDLINPNNSYLVITNSGNKLQVLTKSKSYYLDVKKTNNVIDPTGSGDIFLAMIAALYSKHPFNDCLNHAHNIAMKNLQTIGVPNTELLRKQLQSYDLIA
ncbi:MAG: hypothetical protein GPJ54_13620 [Candidatus Heimdallarchaeota archaeon]|nr:hypothetical protein [Candidatus Heimdallarchaeota archaeon]